MRNLISKDDTSAGEKGGPRGRGIPSPPPEAYPLLWLRLSGALKTTDFNVRVVR